MDKQDKQIMVIPRNILFGNGNHFEGFLPAAAADFESRILSNSKFMQRRLAEQDPSHKQPIGYIIIVNPQTGKVFAYRRASKDSAYSEKRLMGKWSWGLGGHIEESDEAGNPIRASMLRELKEEAGVESITNLRVLGYINDDSDSVGQVHFGILFVAETDSDIKPNSPELELGQMMAIEELEKICSSPEHDIETWSRIALGALKSHIGG